MLRLRQELECQPPAVSSPSGIRASLLFLVPVRRCRRRDLVPSRLPRWRGFNLLEFFDAQSGATQFQPSDFDMIVEWGFNFVDRRVPIGFG